MATPAVSVTRDEIAWPTKKDGYELKEIIGSGATATVHEAFCIPRNEMCAIKRISLETKNQDEMLLLLQKEIQAMSQCNHPNLVNFYKAIVVGDEVWLVMKLLARGSVLDIIKHRMAMGQHKSGVFEEVVIATILKESLKGLEYLHKNGQIHRDIKAGNILLGDDGTVMVADFGVSSFISSVGNMGRERARHTFVGTPCWMAPEVMEQAADGYNLKADIWSFGITAIELATGKAPYHQYPPMKVLLLTLQNEPPNLDTGVSNKNMTKKYSKQFRKMIESCLQRDPEKRPSAAQLLKDPFFKKAKGKEYLITNLLPTAPTLKERSRMPRRVPGSSGRLHKNEDGTWEWSDDENTQEEDEAVDIPPERQATSSAAMKQQEESTSGGTANGIEENDGASEPATPTPDHPGSAPLKSPPLTNPEFFHPPTEGSAAVAVRRSSSSVTPKSPIKTAPPPVQPIPSSVSSQPINLVLRLRNANQELHDIKFAFTVGKDTPDLIAQELVGAGLVDGKDKVIVAANLSKLVSRDSNSPTTAIFPLRADILLSHQTPDEKTLLGFGQLSIVDNA